MAASLPRFTPLKLHRIAEPFNHPGWVFELKYDGFRSIAWIVGRSGAVDRPPRVFSVAQ
jgi:ATP-dependent DNA ligase